MAYDWTLYVILFLALWSAVIGGVFSAFSEFIMKALLQSDTSCGIEAMQEINKTVIPTQFVAGIMIIPVLSIALAIYWLIAFEGPARLMLILAAAVYVSSVFLVTMFGNVPMNNKLDALDAKNPEAAVYWKEYGRDWTRFNHVRSVGSIVTAIIYIAAAVTLITTA